MRLQAPSASALALLMLFGAGCASAPAPSPASTDAKEVVVPPSSASSSSMPSQPKLAFPGILPASDVNKKVHIKTNHGDIVVQISRDMGPNAASNFIYLVKHHFYDGTVFHRVIPGFMIQGGDPLGTGTGGPGYQFPNDEVKKMPTKKISVQGRAYEGPVYEDGWLAMANAGRDTNGSQFFIMVGDYPLPPDYSVFGKVVSGLTVAHKIADLPRNGSDRPNEEVKMISVAIE